MPVPRQLCSSKCPTCQHHPAMVCQPHSFTSLFPMNMLDNNPKGQENERDTSPSFSPSTWSILSSSPQGKVSFYFMIHLLLEVIIPLPSLNHYVLSWRKCPWLVVNQWWVTNGATSKGKRMILLQFFLLLATDT